MGKEGENWRKIGQHFARRANILSLHRRCEKGALEAIQRRTSFRTGHLVLRKQGCCLLSRHRERDEGFKKTSKGGLEDTKMAEKDARAVVWACGGW